MDRVQGCDGKGREFDDRRSVIAGGLKILTTRMVTPVVVVTGGSRGVFSLSF